VWIVDTIDEEPKFKEITESPMACTTAQNIPTKAIHQPHRSSANSPKQTAKLNAANRMQINAPEAPIWISTGINATAKSLARYTCVDRTHKARTNTHAKKTPTST
jgi:hypothetical protein